jgi:hypothetical protein
MKMRTKILTAALFAAIFGVTLADERTERAAFLLTAPSQAAVDYSLTLALSRFRITKEEAHFVKLAQR